MELRIFLLADFANIDAGSKLNIIGAFNMIWADKFPAVSPPMSLVARIAAELGEFGKERPYTIILYDEDANELGKIEGKFSFPQPKEKQRFSEANLVFSFVGLQLPRPGRYEFRLLVNDTSLGVIPLDVVAKSDLP